MLAICFGAGTLAGADAGARVSTVVRPDPKSGKLVRRTVVKSPVAVKAAEVAPRSVEPVTVSEQEAGAPVKRTYNGVDLDAMIEETSKSHDVDPLLVQSVIKVESNYNPAAISPKGAAGLMQLMPATARRFGAENRFDVRENITAGVKYLRYLQGMFKDDRLALAAYNAGEGAVMKYGNVPPYRETTDYVYKVGKQYGQAKSRTAKTQKAEAEVPVPQAEPLRQLEVAHDAEGRLVLRSR